MKIDYLGHSECIFRMNNSDGNEISVMSDVWLSPYCVGDLMGRNPQFTLDYKKLGNIDGIYLSHSHMDHIDPYTLIEFKNNLEIFPTIIISETITYLIPLLNKYLDNPEIIILENKKSINFKGITLEGFIFENETTSNEDDVMGLFVSNDREIVFTEVDTVPGENPNNHDYLYEKFTQKLYDSVVYMATRNELGGNMRILDIKSESERKDFSKEYTLGRREEMEYDYIKHQEGYVEYNDITEIPNFIRLYLGQGLVYPPNINSDYLKMSIMSLENNVSIDAGFASIYGRNILISQLFPGKTSNISAGKITSVVDIEYFSVFKFYEIPRDLSFYNERKLYTSPLNYSGSTIIESKKIVYQVHGDKDINNLNRVHSLINNKFLPYWFGNSENNLKNIILETPNKSYILAIKIVIGNNYLTKYFRYNFGSIEFSLVEKINDSDVINEEYWLDDIIDFLEGKQELYSNFFHSLDSQMSYRLWTMLGANFINNDIVYKKYALHFELAANNNIAANFVEKYYTEI